MTNEIKSFAEAVTGVTSQEIVAVLKSKGKNPDDYIMFPFAEHNSKRGAGRGVIRNTVTGKWTPLSYIKEQAEKLSGGAA